MTNQAISNAAPPIEPVPGKPPSTRRRSIWKIFGIAALVVLALLLVAGIGFVVWANNAAAPLPEALAAMQDNSQVHVTADGWISFTPVGAQPTTGFIFYPGARVDPRAYAPPMQALAAQGYYAAITPMPLNLAILGQNRALDVMKAHPEIHRWVIGGHSLGGAMAAAFADQHPDAVQGVVLWGAYPPDGNSLADQSELVVSSISGALDGLSTPAKIEASKRLLPANATFVPIEGGNHAQFGYYGDQSGDNPATITRADQQQQTIAATLAALEQVAKQGSRWAPVSDLEWWTIEKPSFLAFASARSWQIRNSVSSNRITLVKQSFS